MVDNMFHGSKLLFGTILNFYLKSVLKVLNRTVFNKSNVI